jgi:hypothetical protein|tara:strand:+ start:290 stop:568 length:279 start_codon:yes stop_codon:yes gene_type:complete
MNDPYSSLKNADLRHQINQIKDGHAIQSNQYQLRGVSNTSNLKKDKSRISNQMTSPRARNVMNNEKLGSGFILEEFNNASSFPSRQITGPIT